MIARLLVALTLAVGALASGAARADEGLWTFDNIPTDQVERSLGVRLGQPWLDHLRRAAIRLSTGCSAAVVSRHGLALTNAHCVADCAQSLSDGGADHLLRGFLTSGPREERRCPDMRAEILVGIVDVTTSMFASSAGKTGEAYVAARGAAIARLEADACRGDARYRCQVMSFFGGGQFSLYRYRVFDDVRLVFAPEFEMAFFGGDPDNFTFPRFDLDCAFLRLYAGGKPAVTPDYLTWARRAPLAGEAVFVAGNPAASERGLTVAQLANLRDVALPAVLAEIGDLRDRLDAFSGERPDNARIAAAALFEEENELKIARERAVVLADPAFMAARARDEAGLKALVALDRRLAGEVGDPWADMAALRQVYADQYVVWRDLETGAGGGSRLFAWARLLVRGAVERARPSALRLPEFSDSRLPLIEKILFDDAPTATGLEQLYLGAWLGRTRRELGPASPAVVALIGAEDPAALAARLARESRLSDPAVRRALWRGGPAAIAASDDPMIAFVAKADPLSRAARRIWEEAVLGPGALAAERIARARLAVRPGDIYPDANFSLRLSYGRVDGWREAGAATGPFTTIAGLFARATNAAPYRVTARWLAARGRLDATTVLDFATTNDILGGNSGSPVVDAAGELVGAAFDGNLASIAGDYVYEPSRNRTVAVSAVAITAALDKVYDRQVLLRELEGR
jgi:hypothetical protein